MPLTFSTFRCDSKRLPEWKRHDLLDGWTTHSPEHWVLIRVAPDVYGYVQRCNIGHEIYQLESKRAQ